MKERNTKTCPPTIHLHTSFKMKVKDLFSQKQRDFVTSRSTLQEMWRGSFRAPAALQALISGTLGSCPSGLPFRCCQSQTPNWAVLMQLQTSEARRPTEHISSKPLLLQKENRGSKKQGQTKNNVIRTGTTLELAQKVVVTR